MLYRAYEAQTVMIADIVMGAGAPPRMIRRHVKKREARIAGRLVFAMSEVGQAMPRQRLFTFRPDSPDSVLAPDFTARRYRRITT